MKRFLNLVLLTLVGLTVSVFVNAQTYRTVEYKIWDGTDNKDYDRASAVLYGYLPLNSCGKAVIVCPGGGYQGLAMDYEGTDFAKWFNDYDIAGFVLKYRMPGGRSEVPLADAEQAMRIVREHALEWKIDPEAIGIMGSSAGGHLAATLATHSFSTATRPNFQILLYPVITMNESFTHMGSRNNLLGANPPASLVNRYSNEKQVKSSTPKAFVVVSAADELVPVKNSLDYAQALINKNVPVSLHVYPGGFHGFGHRNTFKDYEKWHQELLDWLSEEVRATVYDDESGYVPDHNAKLLTSVDQLSDNCHWNFPTMDMTVAMLLDGDGATHFHSDANNKTPLSNLNQYIQMDLKTEQKAVQLYFLGRNLEKVGVVTNPTMSMINTPNHIIILATNTPEDEDSWAEVAEFTDGFPGVVVAGEYYSPVIVLDTPARYLRMVVKGAEQSQVYWNISELQVFSCISTGENAISEVKGEKTSQAIYSIDGKRVKQNASDADGLNPGLYIVGEKKVLKN